MSVAAIHVENLSKRYRIGGRTAGPLGTVTVREAILDAGRRAVRRIVKRRKYDEENIIWALKGVSFEVAPGEVVGVIGRNGAGKSTLLKILSRITEPTEGWADIYGRVGALLEVGTGFHPELTGRENVYLNGAILGMRKGEIDRKFDEIVAFAEIERFIDTPVKRYSSGMYTRLAFAVAAHLVTEILLVDEVLAVGDILFQKKCLGKMGEVAREGRTVLFVSHNTAAVLTLCHRGLLLEEGTLRASGPIQDVVHQYLSNSLSLEGEAIFPPGSSPYGSKLRFAAVRILDEAGRPTARVDLTQGARVEIEYEVKVPLASAQVAFDLWSGSGVCVLNSSDLDTDPDSLATVRPPGRYRATCRIEPAFLRPGRYWIDLGSSIPGIEILDLVPNAIGFEVVDTGSLDYKFAQTRKGVVAPIFPWHTVRLGQAGAPTETLGVE